MDGWVCGENASVHYLVAEPFEIASPWNPAVGDSRPTLFGEI